ncbi:MAG TPA: heme exporter protein CcmD [Aquabacterium sp.]|uniref:heme exporter protein CcmD n=1 Tax=Aquabacterium sp. TaxID=1872578 RepID=UPI002E3761BD|nr:heme exporter protein CcmD [Aquabacterium sp.]HEX5374282.1 heme exporter protein CcmD [Aquabacterium sp.]
MQWQSVSEFVAMDGYGLYIWGAYGVTLVCMVVEPWLVGRRRRAAWRDAAQSQEVS